MSNEYLKHIFDQSACLTAKQLKSYVSDNMVHEEAHAVEVHLLSCPFCADAVEGLTNNKSEKAFTALQELPKEFMKKHLGESEVEEYLNKPTVTQSHEVADKVEDKVEKKQRNINVWRITSIAAAVVIGVGAVWLLVGTLGGDNKTTIAENANIKKVEKPQVVYSTPTITDSTIDETSTADTATSAAPQEVVAEEVVTNDAVDQTKKELAKDKPVKKEDVQTAIKPDKNASNAMVAKQVKNTEGDKKTEGVEKRARMGNSYAADEQDNALTAVPEEAAAPKEPESNLTGGQLYQQKRYKEALKKFQKEMNTSDPDRRDNARIMVARCYMALGQNSSAKAILESLVEEKSSEKRQAKKLLKKLD